MKEFLAQDGAPVMLSPKRRSVTVTSVDLEADAGCTACPWNIGPRASALAQATAHAQETGHEVTMNEVRRSVVTAA